MNFDGKMSSQTMALIFAGVVIVLFMTATFALITYAMEDEANKPKAPSNDSGPQAPGLEFESTELETAVKYSLPALIIIGDTREANPSKIDAELAAIEGVRGIDGSQSMFVGSENGALKYKATLVLENEADKAAVFSEIQQKATLLQNMQPISMVIVELPDSMIVTNPDINLSKEFKPAQKNAQAFSSLDTVEGDLIKVVVRVLLSNDVPLQVQAFESSNITGQAQTFFETPEAKITELDKTLYLQGDLNAGNFADENSLKQGIANESLYSIESFSLQVFDENSHEASFTAQLSLNSEDSKPAFEFLKGFFEPKGISFQAAQPLLTNLDSVLVEELGQSLDINSESLWVMAKPGHHVGEDFNFSLMISVQRGKITAAQGAEE